MVLRAICVALGLTGLAPVSVLGKESRPYRFLYDEDFLWTDKKGADRLVRVAKEAGFNVLVPCIWHGRGVTWSSRLPREPKLVQNTSALRDPLAYLISAAHSEELEVHPWFTVVLRQRDFLPEYWDSGTPEMSFDVHREDFRVFISDLILDVVSRYPVDGVNLDYIRAKGICASDRCQAQYREQTGRSLLADRMALKVSDTARENIVRWNEDAVTDVVRRVSQGIRRVRPGVVLSVSSHAAMPELRLEGANSIAWANAGLIDYILHIEYAKVGFMREDLLKAALGTLRDPSRLIMIAGNYEHNPKDKSDVGLGMRLRWARLSIIHCRSTRSSPVWRSTVTVSCQRRRCLSSGSCSAGSRRG